MKLLETIISFISNNVNLLLFYLYNKKVDENTRLEADLKTVKLETEVKTKEEIYAAKKLENDSKILIFKKKMKEYKKESNHE